MRWLVSMEWVLVTREPPYGEVQVAEEQGLMLLNEHPAKYLAGCRRQLRELYDAPLVIGGSYQAMDVQAVFSVIPVDDDLLSEAEIAAFDL